MRYALALGRDRVVCKTEHQPKTGAWGRDRVDVFYQIIIIQYGKCLSSFQTGWSTQNTRQDWVLAAGSSDTFLKNVKLWVVPCRWNNSMYSDFDNDTGTSFEMLLLFNLAQMLFNNMKEFFFFFFYCVDFFFLCCVKYSIKNFRNKHITILWDVTCLS